MEHTEHAALRALGLFLVLLVAMLVVLKGHWTPAQPALKTIASVVVHAHHHAARN